MVQGESGALGKSALVIGVYMSDRTNCISHLVRRFAEDPDLRVEQHWAALGVKGVPDDPMVASVTRLAQRERVSKYKLFNELLLMADWRRFDYVVLCDDDVFVQQSFLSSLLAHQERYDLALAQPARTWSSSTEFIFVLARPWLRARTTHFVESGPVVSFRRDAARLLLPFDPDTPLWGVDMVWARKLRDAGLQLGIIDAVPVDHTIRPQSSGYDTEEQRLLMLSWLRDRPHTPVRDGCRVLERHWR